LLQWKQKFWHPCRVRSPYPSHSFFCLIRCHVVVYWQVRRPQGHTPSSWRETSAQVLYQCLGASKGVFSCEGTKVTKLREIDNRSPYLSPRPSGKVLKKSIWQKVITFLSVKFMFIENQSQKRHCPRVRTCWNIFYKSVWIKKICNRKNCKKVETKLWYL
jgi:hypothetical protein